jgi:hypothetical protein
VRRKVGEQTYSDAQADVRDELAEYSTGSCTAFVEVVCQCGGHDFQLSIDEDSGTAIRTCWRCHQEHAMAGDPETAELEECECLCGADRFELTCGAASDWFFIGARCSACGLTGCYADWQSATAPLLLSTV